MPPNHSLCRSHHAQTLRTAFRLGSGFGVMKTDTYMEGGCVREREGFNSRYKPGATLSCTTPPPGPAHHVTYYQPLNPAFLVAPSKPHLRS
eukprot:3615619-Rhodomonas_salina.1